MKSNIFKTMIFLLATALLCFGTTLTVSANVDGADDSAIEATTDDGSGAEEAIEATDEETDEESSDDNMAGEEEGDDGEAEGEAADEEPAE